ncbi:MAG: helix-turn-helix domain-containing protein [Lactobacillales bacterium]|nr:helix-turn-helix domain-containing protein [Lactobacillales bacterium]
MSYTHLSSEERINIQTLKNEGYSNRHIAKILGRSSQTNNNEMIHQFIVKGQPISNSAVQKIQQLLILELIIFHR